MRRSNCKAKKRYSGVSSDAFRARDRYSRIRTAFFKRSARLLSPRITMLKKSRRIADDVIREEATIRFRYGDNDGLSEDA